MAIANRADTIPAIIQGSTSVNSLTVTNGATATLAGSCLVIAIASATRTVTSITDSANNTWYRLNSNSATGIFGELWVATLTGAIAATTGTITITMSGNGRFCGSFAEYTGVGPVLNGALFDNTGTVSPATTGAQTVSDAGDFLIAAVAKAATGTFTAQNGTIRDQQTTTGLRCALIENTGATSLTDSATMVNATWVTTAADFRLFPLSDDLEFTDQLDAEVDVNLQVSDATVFSEAVTTDLQSSVSPIPLPLQDDESANWAEAMASGWGNALSDQLVATELVAKNLSHFLRSSDQFVMSDQLVTGYALTASDQMVIVESPSFGFGYGVFLSDVQGVNWADLLGETLGQALIPLTLSDQDTTWLEQLSLGYAYQFSDTQVMSDAVGQTSAGPGVQDTVDYSFKFNVRVG